ncbi:MAG: PilN domain-containing protein [Candidatus Andersenbacteria bacterium]|nr:PilN domain-containing protein [Candidatus Andersenbacteria bacterium]
MPSINLAPGTEYIIAARRRRQRLYIISIVIVVVFAIGYGVLFFVNQSFSNQDEALKGNIQTVDAQIQKSKTDATRVSLFEKRLTETKTLLDAHVKWDQVFADVERLLPANVTLTGIDAGTDSTTVSIQGATPDMDSVAQAIASLSSGANHASMFSNGEVKEVTRVEQKNGDQTTTGYTFTITLTIDPGKLRAGAPQ